MQEKSTQFAIDFLNRLKSAYKLTTDIELCHKLGIKQSTMPNWKSRNTVDFDLIIAKCNDISLDWLVSGEGEIYKTQKKYEQAGIVKYDTANEGNSPPKLCKQCKEKDLQINDLRRFINTQSDLVETLKEQVLTLKTASPASNAGQKRKSA